MASPAEWLPHPPPSGYRFELASPADWLRSPRFPPGFVLLSPAEWLAPPPLGFAWSWLLQRSGFGPLLSFLLRVVFSNGVTTAAPSRSLFKHMIFSHALNAPRALGQPTPRLLGRPPMPASFVLQRAGKGSHWGGQAVHRAGHYVGCASGVPIPHTDHAMWVGQIAILTSVSACNCAVACCWPAFGPAGPGIARITQLALQEGPAGYQLCLRGEVSSRAAALVCHFGNASCTQRAVVVGAELQQPAAGTTAAPCSWSVYVDDDVGTTAAPCIRKLCVIFSSTFFFI